MSDVRFCTYFLLVSSILKKSNFSVNSSASSSFERPAEYKLRQLLKELRISAAIHQIPEWTQNEEFAENGSILKLFTDNKETNEMDISDEDINRSKLYMQGCVLVTSKMQ